jgi:hypothetical protein
MLHALCVSTKCHDTTPAAQELEPEINLTTVPNIAALCFSTLRIEGTRGGRDRREPTFDV